MTQRICFKKKPAYCYRKNDGRKIPSWTIGVGKAGAESSATQGT